MSAFLMSKVGTERQLAADVFLSSRTWSHPHAGDFLNLAYGCFQFSNGMSKLRKLWEYWALIWITSMLDWWEMAGNWRVEGCCTLLFVLPWSLLLLPVFLLWCCGQKWTNLCEHSSLFFSSLLLWYGLSIIPYLKAKRLTNFTPAVNQEGTWMN